MAKASKTDVLARKGEKAARVRHYDAAGHEIQRAKVAGVRGARKFAWWCDACGVTERRRAA